MCDKNEINFVFPSLEHKKYLILNVIRLSNTDYFARKML